jgi:hypothetical protein
VNPQLREKVSVGLLVGGYGLAVWAALKFVPTWRERRLGRFLAFEVGTAAVVTGLTLRHRRLEAGANGLILVALALAWAVTRRRP